METLDITDTLAARSDQLNADDLIGGPVTVQVTRVSRSSAEQPIAVHITGHKPFMPCKTMRRVLASAWGADGSLWVGKWLTLYRDPEVRFGGEAVGGVRVSAMSDIPKPLTLMLAVSKGKKGKQVVKMLTPPPPAGGMTLVEFQGHLAAATREGGWTRDQVVALLGCPASDIPPDDRPAIVATLREGPPSDGGAS